MLRRQCRSVALPASPEVQRAATDLMDTLCVLQAAHGFGRGLVGPQIGYALRLIELNMDEPIILCNPRLVWTSPATFLVWDACLSLPGTMALVQRARQVYESLPNADTTPGSPVGWRTLGHLYRTRTARARRFVQGRRALSTTAATAARVTSEKGGFPITVADRLVVLPEEPGPVGHQPDDGLAAEGLLHSADHGVNNGHWGKPFPG
ncbi:MAG: peptide deformylase [Bacillota bacterium]